MSHVPIDDVEDIYQLIHELIAWTNEKSEAHLAYHVATALLAHGAHIAFRYAKKDEFAMELIKNAVKLGAMRDKMEWRD